MASGAVGHRKNLEQYSVELLDQLILIVASVTIPARLAQSVVCRGSRGSNPVGRHSDWDELGCAGWAHRTVLCQAAWKQTVDISQNTKNQTGDTVLTKAPEGLAFTNDYINQAIEQAKAAGIDVTGSSFQPATVTLNEGGA